MTSKTSPRRESLFRTLVRVRLAFNRFHAPRKVTALILLISLSSTTLLAAPDAVRTVVITANEVGQDMRFAYLSNNPGTTVGKWMNNLLLFFKGKQETPQVSRIEIIPGDGTTIRQGEPINFTAIGYTLDGVPVGGLKFDWTIQDAAGKFPARNLGNGIFGAKNPGNFIIKAMADGLEAKINLNVEENKPLMTMKRIKRDEARGHLDFVNTLKQQNQYATGTIDSKKDYKGILTTDDSIPSGAVAKNRPHGPNAGDLEGELKTSSGNSKARMMVRALDEDGWSNNNWWMADDPNNQVGDPPGISPSAGAGNGNFQFSAPIVSLPGRGIDISLSLNYNSRVWSKGGNVMSFDSERGFPGPGWNLGFGKMMFMGTSGGCMLIDADGTNRGYTGTISNYSNGSYSTTNFSGHTTDGTFIDYSCFVSTYNGVTTMSGSSQLPNGTKISYSVYSSNGKQAFPSQIIDAQGNYINITYLNNRGPQIKTVTDTLSRVVTFNYDSLSRLISVDVPKMDNAGVRTAVRLHYKQLTLNPGFAYPLTPDTNNSYPYVVDAIYYPGTGTGYWFGADPGASDFNTYYSSYGMIAKVVEQRGMGWSGTAGDQGTVTAGTMSKQAVYSYTLVPDYTLTDAPTYTTLTESWDGMDTDPVITDYTVNMNSSPRTITVSQPHTAAQGIQVKSAQLMYNASGQWYDGLIYQDQTLDASSNQLSKSVVTWAQGDYGSPRPSQTQITDEKGQVLTTTYTYAAPVNQQTFYNQLISQKEYDYNGTTLLKETRNTYENSSAYLNRHIFSLVKSTEIYDGAGNRVSKTDYEYDNNVVVTGYASLQNTPGVIMHLSSYDPYTTETQDGACAIWQPSEPHSPDCVNEGDEVWVWIAGGYSDTCKCQEYEQVTVYDPNTVFRGNLTKTTVYTDAATPSGSIAQTKQYDETGNIVAESASCCELKTYDYTDHFDDTITRTYSTYAYPTTQTRGSSDPNSAIRNIGSAKYDFNTGLVKQSTDPNGRTSYTTYDANTLRPTLSTTSTGAYKQISYSESAMTITEEIKDSGGATAGKTIKYLNGLGQVKKEEAYEPNNVIDIVETKYDQLARESQQSKPYRLGDTVYYSVKTYNLLGRLTKIHEPDGSETNAAYNETQRPDLASNLSGSTVRVTDAWGRERWGRYDALGRLVEVVEPNPNANPNTPNLNGSVFASGSMVTNYTFDTLGNLTQSNQGGQLRKFSYDSLGRITRQKLAEQTATLDDTGAYVGSGNANAKWSSAVLQYDSRSNIIQKIDARGVITNYSYQTGGMDDPLNRIQSVSYSPPTGIATAPTVSYSYMTTGDQDRLSSVTAAGVSTDSLTYDIEGRVTGETKTLLTRANYPMVTSYTYDSLNRVTSTRLPNQYGMAGSPTKLIENTFDTSSRLTTLKVNGQQQAGGISYNAADQTTSINIGIDGTNQVNEQYTFDPQTRLLTGQQAWRNGSKLLDLSYDYNRNNSIGNTATGKTGQVTKISNNLDHNKDREYQFDALGRLTAAKGGPNSALWTQSYTYDRYGNRTSVAATGVAADNTTMPTDGIPNLTYNAANNQITTSNANGQFEYDVAGNQTRALDKDGVTWLRFEYDAANRLVNIKQDNGTLIQTQQFGVGNERIGLTDVTASQTTWYIDSTEYTENGTSGVLSWSKSCVYLGDSVLSTATPDGQGGEYTEFNHPDRLGTRLITNQQTGSSYEQTHLPFGTALNAESTYQTNPKRFTSYERSARTDLDYAQNRTYDSKLGRFTQADPIGMSASSLFSPQSLNLYAYCGNDPINNIDPSGLFWGSLFRWIGKIFKAIITILIVAVVVATIVIAAVYGGGAALAFLSAVGKSLLGFLASGSEGAAVFHAGLLAGNAGFLGVGAISNFAQQDDEAKKRKDALEEAKKIVRLRLRRFSKCAEAFGGAEKAIKALDSANIEFRDLGDPVSVNGRADGPVMVVKGTTDRAHNTIYINTKGGFGNRGFVYVKVDGGRTVPHETLDPDGNDAETLFHELGHLMNIYGKYDDDKENIKYQKKNRDKIKDCL